MEKQISALFRGCHILSVTSFTSFCICFGAKVLEIILRTIFFSSLMYFFVVVSLPCYLIT